MNSLFTSALVFGLGVLAFGCADNTDADVSSEANVVAATPLVTDATKSVFLTSEGGGTMPVGSDCVPGHESYNIYFGAKQITVVSCEPDASGAFKTIVRSAVMVGTPRAFAPVLTDADFQALRDAASAVTISSKTSCGATPKSLLHMTTTEAANPNINSYVDDYYACDPQYSIDHPVQGLDGLLVVLRNITQALPPRPESPLPTLDILTTPGRSIWRDHLSDLTVADHGSGAVPLGSDCAPGAEAYSFSVANKLLSSRTCAPVAGTTWLRAATQYRVLSDAEIAVIVDAATAAKTSGTFTCAAGKNFRDARTTPENFGSTSIGDFFVDDAAGCRGTGASVNLDGLFDALHTVVPQ